MTTFTVLLDACVLYPAPLRDFSLHLACSGVFRARWSDEIHEEWIRNLLANRPDLTAEQLQRTRELMDRAVPDSLVTGHLGIAKGLILPDPEDKHVLAAAICSNAHETRQPSSSPNLKSAINNRQSPPLASCVFKS
jgi:hypothetical protein